MATPNIPASLDRATTEKVTYSLSRNNGDDIDLHQPLRAGKSRDNQAC